MDRVRVEKVNRDLLQPLTKQRADGLTMALTGVAKYCHPKFSYKPEFTSQSELSSVDAPVPYSLYLPIFSQSCVSYGGWWSTRILSSGN